MSYCLGILLDIAITFTLLCLASPFMALGFLYRFVADMFQGGQELSERASKKWRNWHRPQEKEHEQLMKSMQEIIDDLKAGRA